MSGFSLVDDTTASAFLIESRMEAIAQRGERSKDIFRLTALRNDQAFDSKS